MTMTRLTSKGQVVIPAAIRRQQGLKKGTPFVVYQRGDEIVLRPATREHFRRLAGLFKDGPSLTKLLLAERARDREREDR
jgi:AbrB family looped-hinge helix DNA binding protein